MNQLLTEPAVAEEAWRRWSAETDPDKLDEASVAVLPLLSGRISQWLSTAPERHSGSRKLLGICRRGWVGNQLQFRRMAEAVKTLRSGGVEPAIVCGPAAWAILYQEEKAVRAIENLGILIRRNQVIPAMEALQAAGWHPEAGMPVPEGRALDEYPCIWLRSGAGTPLQLAWRLWNVAPDTARAHEATPPCHTIDIQGVSTFVIPTEELLLDALTRENDGVVHWECDAIVLLRNRHINWRRLRALARHLPAASARLSQIGRDLTTPVSSGISRIY